VDRANVPNAALAPKFYFFDKCFRRTITRSVKASAPTLPACQPWNERLSEIPLISIVDDDDTVRAAIESLVRSLGLQTSTFASAEAFLQSSALSKTRCLVLDVQMPNMTGVDLQSHLHQLGFDIPIIFITAYRDETLKNRVLQAGAVAFLYKPFEVYGKRFADSLLAALNRGKGSEP